VFSYSTESSRIARCCWAVLCLTCTLTCIAALAQDANGQSTQPEAPAVEIPEAPVKVDGETLFRVRGVSAYPAEKRAEAISGRIREVARDRSFDPQELQLSDNAYSTQILAGKVSIIIVFDADAKLEEVGRHSLASAYLMAIRGAIQTYREARQPKVLARHAVQAVVALAALFLFLFFGLKAVRRTLLEVEHRYKHRIREVEIQGLKVLPAERMWVSGIVALKFLAGAAGVVASYVVLDYILALFPWTVELSNNLSGFVLDPLRTITGKFVDAIPNLIFLIVLGVIAYYLLKFIKLIFTAVEHGQIVFENFDPAWARPTYRLVRGFVIAFALVVAFPYIPGSETQAFKGVSLFIGLVFSLGSTSLIGNLVSGYSLTYRKAFKQGDRVKIGGFVGDVQDSKLLVTYLRTPKNEVIAVPNSSIVNSEVINYSSLAHSDGLILHTVVGIGYETPWRQVEAMLLEAAARTGGLLREPKPFAREVELRSFDVAYEINAYCDNPHVVEEIYAELHRNILDQFNQYGVQIMTPAYENDPKDLKVVPRDQWYAAPAVPEGSGLNGRVSASHGDRETK